LPKDVTAKLNAAVVNALTEPTMRQRITDQGEEIPPREELTPQALGVLQKAEIEKWWPIINAAGIKVRWNEPSPPPTSPAGAAEGRGRRESQSRTLYMRWS
jgi:hypothetical protein